MNNLYKEIKISSSTENIYKVEKFIEEICDSYYITNSYFANILVSVEEAVKNAIFHGNKMDKQKKIQITFRRIPTGLSFTITDQGNGFDYMSIPNPVEADSGIENSGNGLFLIRTLSDKVSFNSKGNQVEIVFNISSISQETTLNRIIKINQYFLKQTAVVKPEDL